MRSASSPSSRPNPDAALVACDRSGQEFAPAGADCLGHGQRRREYHRRGMQHRTVVQVVLLDDMRGSCVDQRGEEGRALPSHREQLRRPPLRSHGLREALQDLRRPRALAREDRAEPVEKQLLGARDDRLRDLFVAQRRDELRQRAAWRGGGLRGNAIDFERHLHDGLLRPPLSDTGSVPAGRSRGDARARFSLTVAGR
jgi:hypothetical protein